MPIHWFIPQRPTAAVAGLDPKSEAENLNQVSHVGGTGLKFRSVGSWNHEQEFSTKPRFSDMGILAGV